MKVIVLGATGVIGLPVSQALSRAGHIVYGVTRSDSNARKLATEEIIPIIAEPTSDSESARKLRPPGSPKLTYVYTSGIWIHGDSRKDVVSDTAPLTQPIDLVTWRIPFEQAVTGDPNLNGISASEGKVAWYGSPGGRYCLVHADDLADLYVRAVEKAQILGGQIFDAANDFTESVDDLMQRLTEVSGARCPYEYVQPSNLFEAAIGTTVLCRPSLARALLGWVPRKAGLVDGLGIYYAAWSASRQVVCVLDIAFGNAISFAMENQPKYN
ncbi:hypothetical protein EYR36_003378 [Pleurotus pulmonarius]|nr:hypothetical protein EYR36_003378 [Pleurotus pulmonarius]